MKKSIFAKMLVLVLALVTVFAFATTAFAVYDEYIYNRSVHGGPSEFQARDIGWYRTEPNTMDVYPIAIDWLGESGWKYRGYIAGSGTATTGLKQMYDTKYYTNAYTSGTYANMNLKMSISSSDYTDWLVYSGYLYF